MEEPLDGNGNVDSASAKAETEEETAIGPGPAPRSRPKRPLQFEQAYLDTIPSANMYEKSYMHRDVVTHVAVSSADFFITGSDDGHLKFWKKKPIGIEFAKHFRSHLGPIEGIAVSVDGLLCCTISNDHSVKIYDVVNYDMMVMIRLPFIPGAAEWVYKQGDVKARLAISDRNSSFVHIYDARSGSNEPIASREVHLGPVKIMKYNHVFDSVISADAKGLIEYWSPDTLQFPENDVNFKFKSDTNLFEIVKCKTTVSAIEVSPDGKQFSITSPDRRIRVFWYRTGKLRRVYDESLEVAQDLQRSDAPLYRLEAIDFGRRMAVEKEIEKTESAPQPNAVFDESSNFLIYATLLGIKVVNLHTNKVARILGKVENNDRFLRIALYQGDKSSKKVRKIPSAAANANESKEPLTDPTLLCCAFKKHRIYLFSRREPEEPEDATKGRDVFNEKPPADELLAVSYIGKSVTTSLPDNVILHTTMGDIHMRLYPEECPKTVENFTTHCRNGYYDNLIFHRVIKGFMIQTGDPLGDGTGGQSIWGREFEDEFHKSLHHAAHAGVRSSSSWRRETRCCSVCSAQFSLLRKCYTCVSCGSGVCSKCCLKTATGPSVPAFTADSSRGFGSSMVSGSRPQQRERHKRECLLCVRYGPDNGLNASRIGATTRPRHLSTAMGSMSASTFRGFGSSRGGIQLDLDEEIDQVHPDLDLRSTASVSGSRRRRSQRSVGSVGSQRSISGPDDDDDESDEDVRAYTPRLDLRATTSKLRTTSTDSTRSSRSAPGIVLLSDLETLTLSGSFHRAASMSARSSASLSARSPMNAASRLPAKSAAPTPAALRTQLLQQRSDRAASEDNVLLIPSVKPRIGTREGPQESSASTDEDEDVYSEDDLANFTLKLL